MEENEIISEEATPDTVDENLDAEITPDAPEVSDATDVPSDPYERYLTLCDMGLTPREAYLESIGGIRNHGGKSHLSSTPISHGRVAHSQMSRADLECAREIFSGLSDADIRRLYRKVTN